MSVERVRYLDDYRGEVQTMNHNMSTDPGPQSTLFGCSKLYESSILKRVKMIVFVGFTRSFFTDFQS